MKTRIYPYFCDIVTYVYTQEHWTRMRFLKSHSSCLNITCLHKSPSHPLSSISPGLSWFIANVFIVPVQSTMQQLQTKDQTNTIFHKIKSSVYCLHVYLDRFLYICIRYMCKNLKSLTFIHCNIFLHCQSRMNHGAYDF